MNGREEKMSALHLNCFHSITITGSSSQPEYIFDIKSSLIENKLLVSSSNHHLSLYDYDLNLLQTHHAHRDTITSIAFAKTSPNIYYSASADKSVVVWDSRNLNASTKIRLDEEVPAMTVNASDNLLVVAQGVEILFYDIRALSSTKKPKVLGRYSDVHSDEVTQLAFSPFNSNVLLSGGEDGLLGLYGIDAIAAEDAVLSILNTECPVNRIGYFGNNYEGVFALSTVETASLWHFPSAQRIIAFPTIREQFNMDYLVDCIYETGTGQLYMLIGNHEGHSELVLVNPTGAIDHSNIMTYNNSTIRSICCPESLNQDELSTLYSGGEDGRLNILRKGEPGNSGNHDQRERVAEVGAVRVQVTKKNRYSPY